MPGFATHYVFGVETLRKWDNDTELIKYIRKHRAVYDMGLQGPDMFFYYFFSKLFYKKNIGSTIHTKDIGNFKKNFLSIAMKEKDVDAKEILLSYFAGFVGHCTLDCECHPYVYAVTDYEHKGKNYFSKHVSLETNIDCLYCERFLGKDLYEYRKKDYFKINAKEEECLARAYVKAIKKTYPKIKIKKGRMKLIIKIFKYSNIVFRDRCGIKKKIVGAIEQIVLKRKVISPMFMVKNEKRSDKDVLNQKMSKWISPWEKEKTRTESFDILFDRAVCKYIDRLEELNKCIHDNSIENADGIVNNLSLHSGLDCKIPS